MFIELLIQLSQVSGSRGLRVQNCRMNREVQNSREIRLPSSGALSSCRFSDHEQKIQGAPPLPVSRRAICPRRSLGGAECPWCKMMAEEWLEGNMQETWGRKQSLGESWVGELAPEWRGWQFWICCAWWHKTSKGSWVAADKGKGSLHEAGHIHGRLWVPDEWLDGVGSKSVRGAGGLKDSCWRLALGDVDTQQKGRKWWLCGKNTWIKLSTHWMRGEREQACSQLSGRRGRGKSNDWGNNEKCQKSMVVEKALLFLSHLNWIGTEDIESKCPTEKRCQ